MDPQVETQTILGRRLTLRHESGRTTAVTLRPIRVREFTDLMGLLGREMTMIERSLGVADGSLADGEDPIAPDSYEELAIAFQELNAPFFGYCARQTRLVNQIQGKAAERALATALERSLSASAAGSSVPR